MKILFLDIDSVMTVHDWNKADPPRDEFDMIPFTSDCVDALNEIILETDCAIVLSSDHKHNHSLEILQKIFEKNGCISAPFDITPTSKLYRADNLDEGRAHEILLWLENNKDVTVDKWVAVDDLVLTIGQFSNQMKDHFVNTCDGIHLVKWKIIKILNG